MIRTALLATVSILLCACSGQQITRVQPLADGADAPYKNVLVVSLFDTFDPRRYLEQEIVRELKARGINAVASTSMMDSRTPMERETFIAMIDELDADALLVTSLMDFHTDSRVLDASPEATYIIRPTYYFNVWNVNLTEFVGPQDLEQTHSFVLASQLFSVSTEKPVWAIESKTKIVRDHQNRGDPAIYGLEAAAIARTMSTDGLLP